MITAQLRKRGGSGRSSDPKLCTAIMQKEGTSAPEERRWFISHVAECVNSSLVLNKIRPCFLPITRNVYFLTDFHTTALLLCMYHYLSHFALPAPPPWLWGSASRRELSCQVCVNLSDTRWGRMEWSLLTAVFTLFSVLSRPAWRETLPGALPVKDSGRKEGSQGRRAAARQWQKPGIISLPPAACSGVPFLWNTPIPCSLFQLSSASLVGEERGRGAEEWEKREQQRW